MEKERLENVLKTELTQSDVKTLRTYYLKFYNDPESFVGTDLISLILVDLDKVSDDNWVMKEVPVSKKSNKKKSYGGEIQEAVSNDDSVNNQSNSATPINLACEETSSSNVLDNVQKKSMVISDLCYSACVTLKELVVGQMKAYEMYDKEDLYQFPAYVIINSKGLTKDDKIGLFTFSLWCYKFYVNSKYAGVPDYRNCYPAVDDALSSLLSDFAHGVEYKFNKDEFKACAWDKANWSADLRDVTPELHECRNWFFDDDRAVRDLEAHCEDATEYQLQVCNNIHEMIDVVYGGGYWEHKHGGDIAFSAEEQLMRGIMFSFIFSINRTALNNRSRAGIAKFHKALTRFSVPYCVPEKNVTDGGSGIRSVILKAGG